MVDQREDIVAPAPEPCRLRLKSKRRRTLPYRLCISGVALLAGLAVMAVLGAGVFVARLSQGPIVVSGLGEQIAAALDARLGKNFHFDVGETSITKRGYGPTLSIDSLSLHGSTGETIFTAPLAEVSVDPLALVIGRVTPRRLELFDVDLRLIVSPDGSLALATGSGHDGLPIMPPLPVSPASVEQPVAPDGRPNRAIIMRQAAAALRNLLDGLTSRDSAIAAVDRVAIERGRLTVDDRTSGQSTVFNGLDVAFDKSPGSTKLNLAVDGPNGRWSVAAQAWGAPAAERNLDLSLEGLSLDEIGLATGLRNLGVDFDTPLSAHASVALAANGDIMHATGGVDLGSGYFRLDDPDQEPLLIDSVTASIAWDGKARQIRVENAEVRTGGTHLRAGGTLTPPRIEGDSWEVGLALVEPGVFGAERPREQPLLVQAGRLDLRILPAEKHLAIDSFVATGSDFDFSLDGTFDWLDGPRMRLAAKLGSAPARTVLRLWPSAMAAPIRSWFLSHVQDGTVKDGKMRVDFDGAAFEAVHADKPPPDAAVTLDFAVANGRMSILPGVPPLSGVDGVAHITGRSSNFAMAAGTIDAGAARRLVMTDGTFHVADASVKPVAATLGVHVVGSMEAVGDLLSREALKPYASLPVDGTSVKGLVDGRMNIDMSVGPGSTAEDTHLRIAAGLTNFSADKLIGKERFEAGTLTVAVDPAGLKITGNGRIFNAPAQVDVSKPADRPGEASISLVLDDAARAKQGLPAISGVTGPIAVHVVAPIGGTDKPKAAIDLDLTRVALDNPVPGLAKPAGRPGRMTLTASLGDDATVFDAINLDIGTSQVRGTVELAPDQSIASAKFPMVRLSPGDDMKVDVARGADGLKIVVRAAAIDVRPFLKPFAIVSGESSAAAAAPSTSAGKDQLLKDVDLDLKANLLTGFNRQVLSGADLRVVKHGDQLRQFALAGRFGGEALRGSMTNAALGAPQLDVSTADSGSLLSFLDLYKHMEGGRLTASMRLGDGGMAGVLDIKDFTLRNEPALRRLVSEGVPTTTIDERGGLTNKIDAGAVAFTKLGVHFERVGSRLELHDGTMYGAEIGLTVDGSLDFAKDYVSMRGTFVPAYAVNNLFSQIPVFGALLGGGTNEGLFAINYRIDGSASQPTLSVNPLSAIAPGFLRKIFGDLGDLEPQPQAGAARSTRKTSPDVKVR